MNLISYFRQVRAEMKHVVFPDVSTAVAHTALIIVFGALVAIFISLLDAGFTRGVEFLIIN